MLVITLLLAALVFQNGYSLTFGVGNELVVIPFPQSDILANLSIIAAFIWLMPPWMIARLSKWIKRRMKPGINIRLLNRIKRNEQP